MLMVFTRDYVENPSSTCSCRSYATALEAITRQINTYESYSIIKVEHEKSTYYSVDGSRIFLEYPFGTVTVLADVIPKKSDSLAQMFK